MWGRVSACSGAAAVDADDVARAARVRAARREVAGARRVARAGAATDAGAEVAAVAVAADLLDGAAIAAAEMLTIKMTATDSLNSC